MSARQSRKPSATRESSATDHLEVEWQFDVDEPEPVECWLGQHYSASGFVVAPEPPEEIIDTYYDSGDWRFYRAGYALRVRNAGGAVEAAMKSPAPDDINLRRRELGTTTGGPRVPRGAAFTMGVYSEHCAREAAALRTSVPGSKPFRTLTKGRRWKDFEGPWRTRGRARRPGPPKKAVR